MAVLGSGQSSIASIPRSRWTLVVLLSLLALALLALAPSTGADAVTWLDKEVTGEESYSDLNVTLDGNLTVADGGTLYMSDVRWVVNATRASQYTISVEEGGLLHLENVTVSSGGGTYRIEVRGYLGFSNGSIEDLEEDHHVPTVERGLVVLDDGELNIEDVEVVNPSGYAIYINDTGLAVVRGGRLYGASTAVRVNDGGALVLMDTVVGCDLGTDLVILMSGAEMAAHNTTFESDDPYSSSVHDAAVTVLGDEAGASLEECTIATHEIATMNGGYLELLSCEFQPPRSRPIPDLNVRDADVIVEDLPLQELVASGSIVELWKTTYATGTISNGSTLLTYGPVPPLEALSGDSTLHHHYLVDLMLLNATEDPEEGIDVSVINSEGGLVLNEARSDADGMVHDVPIRSWTLVDGRLTYEPSHRVEFAGPSYQISNLQVYDNGTVTLWDRAGSYDLVLRTDSVEPSIPAPEENRTFDLVVDGDVLIPYTWADGTAKVSLFVDGELHLEKVVPLDERSDVILANLDLKAGTHLFRVLADPGNMVREMNEGGNNELRFILDVSPEGGTGELVDLTVEIARVGDTAGESGEELLSGIIYVDYTVRARNTKVIMRNVPVAIYVNEAMDDIVRVDLVDTEGDVFVFNGQFRLNLPRGDYVINVVVDPNDEIDEEREYNNEDQSPLSLTDDTGDPQIFDETCCLSMLIFGLIAAVGVMAAWAQRRQRMAAEGDGATQYGPSQVTQTAMPGSQTYVGQPQYGVQRTQARMAEPRSLDERWQVEQRGGAYTADGWEEGVADRITGPGKRPPPARERFKATNLTCPRCRGRDIMGFADGSAKCQSCKKIFYPGRR
jgi:hypothetical protein